MTTVPQPADPTTSYTATYDAWNRLVKLTDGANTVQENEYDARRFRTVRKDYTAGTLDETRRFYYRFYYTESWQSIEERLGTSTAPEVQHVWGLRYIDDLALRDRDATTADGTLDERLYAVQDANWNVTAITDANGDVQERYAYAAYGTPTFLTPAFVSRSSSSYRWDALYCGYRWDATSELFAVRHRCFSAIIGAWISRDPEDYNDFISLYTYVQNMPADAIDPLGLQHGMTPAPLLFKRIAKQRARLKYLHCIMKWMVALTNARNRTTCYGCIAGACPSLNMSTTFPFESEHRTSPFPESVSQYVVDVLQYSYTTYTSVNDFSVNIGGLTGVPGMPGAGLNMPGVPGFSISMEVWNKDESAIITLAHEPQHDANRGGLGGHDDVGRHIRGAPKGTNLEDNVSDIINWLKGVCEHRAGGKKGKSLWQRIKELCKKSASNLPPKRLLK